MAQGPITGLFQWVKWGVAAATGATGIVTGGDGTIDPDFRKRLGIGGNERRRGGLLKIGGTAEFYINNDNAALVAYGLRASYPRGGLTALKVSYGADEWGRAHTGCYITEGNIDYAQGEGLKANMTWGGTGVAEAAGSSMPAADDSGFEDYQCAVRMGSAYHQVQSFAIKWTNNVSFHGSGDAGTPGALRVPKMAIIGVEELTVDLTTATPIPTDSGSGYDFVGYDCLQTALTLNLDAEGCDGETLAIGLSNMSLSGPEAFGFVDPNTLAGWKYSFAGSSYAGSLTWVYTP